MAALVKKSAGVAHLTWIVVAQILEAPEIGDLAGREKRIGTEVACQEGQRIESYRHSLRFVGYGLFDVVCFAVSG